MYAMGVSRKTQVQVDRLNNRLKLWKISQIADLASNNPESLSELDDYLTLCKLASQNTSYFKKFRSCKSYRAILENVDGVAGEELVNAITNLGRTAEEFSHLWHPEIGRPYTYHVSNLGRISPTELRYSKILCELDLFFGSLNDFSISEIGVGFGGQGGQIMQSNSVREYEFIDLKEPLELVNRYLTTIQAAGKKVFTQPQDVQERERDLVISNYAYSELNQELQEFYLNKVLSKSKRGFVIYNHITPTEYKTMSAKEFAKRIPGSEVFEEKPLSHPGNVLVVWGHKSQEIE